MKLTLRTLGPSRGVRSFGFFSEYVEATTASLQNMKKITGVTRLNKVPGDAKDLTFSDCFLIL